jgi:hypothetical protein
MNHNSVNPNSCDNKSFFLTFLGLKPSFLRQNQVFLSPIQNSIVTES